MSLGRRGSSTGLRSLDRSLGAPQIGRVKVGRGSAPIDGTWARLKQNWLGEGESPQAREARIQDTVERSGPVARFYDMKLLDGPVGPLVFGITALASYLGPALGIGLTVASAGDFSDAASITGVVLGTVAGGLALWKTVKNGFEHPDRMRYRRTQNPGS